MCIPLQDHLFQAAVLELDFPNEGLWIDQICIDQRSEAEKRVTIPVMSALHKHARKVIVCLDDTELSIEDRDFLKESCQDQGLSRGQFFLHLGEDP